MGCTCSFHTAFAVRGMPTSSLQAERKRWKTVTHAGPTKHCFYVGTSPSAASGEVGSILKTLFSPTAIVHQTVTWRVCERCAFGKT